MHYWLIAIGRVQCQKTILKEKKKKLLTMSINTKIIYAVQDYIHRTSNLNSWGGMRGLVSTLYNKTSNIKKGQQKLNDF
jgi:hypothetical protein